MENKDVQEAMLKQLKQPFDPKFLKWRVGATSKDKKTGIALPYLDAREVMKRLDDVCGLAGWQDDYVEVDKGFICKLQLLINDQWVTKSNTGENTRISPVKGGGSDAFKRAATRFGIGRYLYYMPQVWVAIKPKGDSYVLAEIPELPKWAVPNETIERWEDIAELQADKMIGDEQETIELAIETIDKIRDAETIESFDKLVSQLSEKDKVILANELSAKQRELNHAAKVKSDNN